MDNRIIFVSYSHKDRDHLNEFIKHLRGGIRDLPYQIWYDDAIGAGDELDRSIEDPLGTCRVFCALMSPDYLASEACQKELTDAQERADKDGAPNIMPIVLRHCQWQVHNKSDRNALPYEGTPVIEWNDVDRVWNSVTEKIRAKLIEIDSNDEARPVSPQKALDFAATPVPLSPTFVDKISRHGLVLQHKNAEHINLPDIFVFPDLRELTTDEEQIEREINSTELVEQTKAPSLALMLGDEQSGKSSLCGMLFMRLHESGYHPIILDGAQIGRAQPDRYIEEAIKEQYDTRENEIPIDIVLIDDADEIRLNERHLPKFLEQLRNWAPRIYAFADDSLRFKESKYVQYADFRQFDIMYFGHLRRAELIENWIQFGQEESIELSTLRTKTDETKRNVDSVVRRNVVPAKPVFLLTIIQSLDQYTSTDVTLTSYGHCYQYLVYQALERARIENKKIDMYLNYLTFLAHFMFTRGVGYLSDRELKEFKSQYHKRYLHDDHNRMMDKLLTAGIVHKTPKGIGFRYKYILYFFAAKYIADHIEVEEVTAQFEDLLQNVHLEKNANVIIFITHHTKSHYVFEQIELKAMETFQQLEPASLEYSETKHLLSFVEEMPQLILEDRSVDEERMKALKRADQAEKMPEWSEEDADADASEEAEWEDSRQLMREINTSLRMVEIMGQIIRNRYGSLTRDQLGELSGEAFDSGLRFLSFVLGSTDLAKEHVVRYLSEQLREHQPEGTYREDRKRAERDARRLFLGYCYSVIYGFLRKMAHSLGNERLTAILRELRDERGTPSAKLVSVIAALEFEEDIPYKDMEQLLNSLDGNPIAERMLKQAAIQHCYLHEIEYTDRQWLADKMRIPIEKQRIIQGRVRGS